MGKYLVSRGEEEQVRKRRKIFGVEKYLVSGGEEEQRRKRRKIFGKGKSDDGQTDVQNVLLFPSVEGVK